MSFFIFFPFFFSVKQNTYSRLVSMSEVSTGDLVTVQEDGSVRLWQMSQPSLSSSLKTWREAFGLHGEQMGHLELKRSVDGEAAKGKTTVHLRWLVPLLNSSFVFSMIRWRK